MSVASAVQSFAVRSMTTSPIFFALTFPQNAIRMTSAQMRQSIFLVIMFFAR